MTFLIITFLISLASVQAVKANRVVIESWGNIGGITIITYALLNVYLVLAGAAILTIVF